MFTLIIFIYIVKFYIGEYVLQFLQILRFIINRDHKMYYEVILTMNVHYELILNFFSKIVFAYKVNLITIRSFFMAI